MWYPLKGYLDGKHNVVMNAISTLRRRTQQLIHGLTHDDQRDIYAIFGYKRDRSFELYYEVWRLQDIANRVINAVARSCWRQGAEIKLDDKVILEDEMSMLKKLGLFTQIEKADILNRIGRFSVLYVGVPDGLDDPKAPLGNSGPVNLDKVFFSPYAEDGITIQAWDMDPISQRFGQPELYNLQVRSRGNDSSQTVQTQAIMVHWSRVVHLAEGALDNPVEGLPALEPLLNRLQDINKTVGGSAEAYFRNARGKYSLETDKDFKGNLTDKVREDLKAEVEAFTNNWQDVMRLSGVQAKVLNTPHASPEHTFKAAIELISGATGIPIRILLGVGAGQLAGNEDKASYNELINDRQDQLCSQWLLGVLTILSKAGLISEIPEKAEIEFPLSDAVSEKERAETRKLNSEALNNVSAALSDMGGLAGEVGPEQAITELLELEYKPVDNDGADNDAMAEAAAQIAQEQAAQDDA